MRNLTYPYPLTEGAFWPFGEVVAFPDVSVWKRPYLCRDLGPLVDEAYFNFACSAQPPEPGAQWYWICGTGWENGDGETSRAEYLLVVIGICLLGMAAYTQALCYPRNIFEQLFHYREWPQYYKTNAPSRIVTEIQGRRIGEGGEVEFLVTREARPGEGGSSGGAAAAGSEGAVWCAQSDLVQDGAGEVFGERGGHYGAFYDTYGSSTRDRLRTYDAHAAARERIERYQRPAAAAPVVGLSYRGGRPVVARADEGAHVVGRSAASRAAAKAERPRRSRTPSSRR